MAAFAKGTGLNSIPNRFGLMALVLTTIVALVAQQLLAGPMTWLTAAGIAALVALPVAANYLAARKLSRMIRSLQESTEALVSGDFNSPVEIDCQCEVGGLADGFRAMVRRLNSNILRMNVLAYTDTITGLPNRSVIHHILNLAKRSPPGECAATMVFIDLDGFKRVNDTLGHEAGDELLRLAAQRIITRGLGTRLHQLEQCTTAFGELCQTCPTKPVFARYAGDEFLLLLPGSRKAEEVDLIANRIRDAFADAFTIDNNEVTVSASMGIAQLPEDTTDPEQLLAYADIAMYAAKESGKNGHVFFDSEIKAKLDERIHLERELQLAVESNGLDLHFQPKFDARTLSVTGVEALARWHCPDYGPVSPDSFVRVAERCGLMVEMGNSILRRAIWQAKDWAERGQALPVAVNVSPVQFEQVDFVPLVISALEQADLSPDLLELEITETIAMADFERTRDQVDALRRMGVRVSIDDFGNGYSNLSQLARLEYDSLKVDRSLVASIGKTGRTNSMWLAIFNVAKALGQKIVAEGIESHEQLDYLRSLGCDEFQGFLLARPMPAHDFECWLAGHQLSPAIAMGEMLEIRLQQSA